MDFSIPLRFIPDAELTGKYSQDSLSSFTSKVIDQKGPYVDLGSVNLDFGNTRYAVTPYAYWARNGALVFDYAVAPGLSAPGFDPTWWQVQYGGYPDPTFILPWLNDRARGLSVTDAQLKQTRDILFDPVNPLPGGTVSVKARVRNFSLIPTAGPVKAQSSIGNPDSGGTLITGVDGQTDRFTSGPIASRGNATVGTGFVVPSSLGQFSRIYVVLDPNITMTEVHEDNNRGWTVLTLGSPATSIARNPDLIPGATLLEQNYPNPFNPTTRIDCQFAGAQGTGGEFSAVRLAVFDLLGREVAVLVNEKKRAGSYSVIFDGTGLASGVYLCRLQAGGSVLTRKLILVK